MGLVIGSATVSLGKCIQLPSDLTETSINSDAVKTTRDGVSHVSPQSLSVSYLFPHRSPPRLRTDGQRTVRPWLHLGGGNFVQHWTSRRGFHHPSHIRPGRVWLDGRQRDW